MTETYDDAPRRGIEFGADAPRDLDIRITAAKGCGFTLTDMSDPEAGVVAAFTGWRDCLHALQELLCELPGEVPDQPDNGRAREPDRHGRGHRFWGR